MITVNSEIHALHNPSYELYNGQLIKPFESPDRVGVILKSIYDLNIGEVIPPSDFGLEPVLRVHAPNYVTYLQTAWDAWNSLGREYDILPFAFPRHGMNKIEPDHIDGKVGYFSFDTGAPICANTWEAVKGSVNCALTAQKIIAGGKHTAFALCRPPGHHAGTDFAGGYCYINNVAVAAQAFLDDGAKRVAVLDIDYHHGNGTQEIFYRRSEVLFTSIHADPKHEFPYFLGYEAEIGEGEGLGFNLNYPLQAGATFEKWGAALHDACKKIVFFDPDVIVVSLGLDTFEHDPISKFKLTSMDYLKIGEIIGKMNLPTLFVLEGGYAVDQFGLNTANVLEGFHSTTA